MLTYSRNEYVLRSRPKVTYQNIPFISNGVLDAAAKNILAFELITYWLNFKMDSDIITRYSHCLINLTVKNPCYLKKTRRIQRCFI